MNHLIMQYTVNYKFNQLSKVEYKCKGFEMYLYMYYFNENTSSLFSGTDNWAFSSVNLDSNIFCESFFKKYFTNKSKILDLSLTYP